MCFLSELKAKVVEQWVNQTEPCKPNITYSRFCFYCLIIVKTIKMKMTYFKRVSLEEVLEEEIFFNYEQYSNLLEDSEW